MLTRSHDATETSNSPEPIPDVMSEFGQLAFFDSTSVEANAFLLRLRETVDSTEDPHVRNAASVLVSELQKPNGERPNDERVFDTLYDIHAQGKMPELQRYLQDTFQFDLRDQLYGHYPLSHERIEAAIEHGRPAFRGLNRGQLQTVLSKFPELQGVISDPMVLGAILQNEWDHTYGAKDVGPDIVARSFSFLNRMFGRGDGTEFLSRLNPQELRERARSSGTIMQWIRNKGADWEEALLRNSIGPGQMQIQNILSLREQERLAGRTIPSVSMSQTTEGAAQLVAAYLTRSITELDANKFGDAANDPNSGLSPARRRGYLLAQQLWNSGDPASRERALVITYNAGASGMPQTGGNWGAERILRHYLRRGTTV